MKKITLAIAFILIFISGFSQLNKIPMINDGFIIKENSNLTSKSHRSSSNNNIFFEDFENGMPQSFILYNQDNLNPYYSGTFGTNAWAICPESYYSDNKTAASPSNYVPSGQADDWMVIPNITLTNNCNLSWISKANDFIKRDGLQVYISTTGTQIADFNTCVYNSAQEFSFMKKQVVSLIAYNGQTINIAFRNNSINKEALLVDDISVYEADSYDADLININKTPTSEYVIIAKSQATYSEFNADVRNNGYLNLTNVSLNVNINNGLYNQSNVISTLAPGAISTINIASAFDPASYPSDTFNVVYTASCDEADVMLANNKDTMSIIVSDSVMSRESGLIDINGLGFNALGVVYQLNSMDTLSSVSVYLDATAAGAYKAEVWQINGSTYTLKSTSLIKSATANQTGWSTLSFGTNCPIMQAGTKYLVVVRTVIPTNFITIGASTENYTPNTSFFYANGSWVAMESFIISAISFGIRANFGDCSSFINNVENQTNSNFHIFPNPAQDFITISSDENISKIELIDCLGQTVCVNSPNSNIASIPVNTMAKGVYFMKINDYSIKKVIIK
ncbi:MAG: choice-of-anchor J domain-containing protein [Bacteroidota bacterium]